MSGSASGAPKASAAAASKSVVTRVDGRELRRMTIYLETKLATRLRVHATTLDVDQSDVIAQALTAWLERSGA